MTSAPRSASVVVIAPGPSIEHSTIRTLARGAGGWSGPVRPWADDDGTRSDAPSEPRGPTGRAVTPGSWASGREFDTRSAVNAPVFCHVPEITTLNVAIRFQFRLPFRNRNTPPFARPAAGAQCSADHPDPLRRAPRLLPPTQEDPRHDWDGPPPEYQRPGSQPSARRALWSSVAAIAVVVGPISLASAANGPESAGAAEPPTTISDLHEELAGCGPRPRASRSSPTSRPWPRRWHPRPPTDHHRATHHHHATAPPPPPPPAAVAPVATGSGYNDPNNPAAWDRLAQCESGGNWATNTGNGYYGGIQFSLASWHGVGGTGYPHQASRETQIAMGQRLWNQGGWSHWPACTSKLGYR